jgi:cysteinyl-tRNA synthetase
MLRLHDTATGTVRDLALRTPGKVSMYVCGPTVYGPPHLGHGRFSLVFDVLRRYLLWSGFDVDYVSNITDVDDNIIGRARTEGRTEHEVAVECEAIWWEAMDAIGVMRPTSTPHATAYIDRMIALIEQLVERGAAYQTEDGVFLEVSKVDGYGQLARQDLDSLRAGARVEVDERKRSPLDFVLWKPAKPDEVAWDSPWGRGRPGWHTECVAMSLDLLGDGFDLHGGGQDLAFPHHENERAQAIALGRSFARHWVHNGFVEVDGEKMSKSLGNFTTLVDLVETVDPRAYRLLVLRSHYRTPLEVTRDTAADAAAALGRLDAFARRTSGLEAAPDDERLDAFRTAMDDDLQTPTAVDLLFTAVRDANRLLDAGDDAGAAPLAAFARAVCAAVGLELHDLDDAVPPEVQALLDERLAARADRDFARADAIRDQLVADGWELEDTPGGTLARRAR